MLKKTPQSLPLVRKFVTICDQANIWYALDRRTLWQSQQPGGASLMPKRFEVMVTLNSYKKLKRACAQHVVDSFLDPTYKLLSPLFVANKADWKSPQPVVSIRVLIPTTVQRLQRFLSLFTAIKNIFWWRPQNIKTVINTLIEHRYYHGYYLLESKRRFVRQNWIQTLSFRRLAIDFGGLKVKIMSESDIILKDWYGLNYAKPSGRRS